MSDTTHHIGFLRGNPFTSAHAAFAEHIKDSADKEGAGHTIVLTRSHDAKKNPLSPEEKLKHAKRAVPDANFTVASKESPTLLHHASNLHKKGVKNLVVHASSDRVGEFNRVLHNYNGKEGPHGKFNFKKIDVKQFGGERTEGGKGMEGVSGTKMRGFAKGGTEKHKKQFFKMAPPKMSDEHKQEMWNDTRKGMQMESTTPVGIFLIGGPGSGKDYVLKNIFSRFDLIEVQADQILNGAASELYENNANIVINGALDEDKIATIQMMLEGYAFDHVYVSVTNKVSRTRNSLREQPLPENKRIQKFLAAEKLAEQYNCFNFNNSINLNESSEFEKVFFASQIEKILERVVNLGLTMTETPEPKAFTLIREKTFPPVRHHKSGLPSKYVKGLTPSEIAAKKSRIKSNAKLSDSNPKAYKDMPGDKRIREKGIPLSKYTKKYHAMYGEAATPAQQAAIAINMKKKGIKPKNEEVELDEGAADTSLAAKAKKSGVSLGTLRKVYNRGVAAWNSGHRPGTTPAQWGHARVNSYITKGKTYHTADKDLREEKDINALFEMQLVGTDEYRKHAIAMTPGQSQEIANAFDDNKKNKTAKEDCGCGGNCKCDSTKNESYGTTNKSIVSRSFKKIREGSQTVDTTPTLNPKKQKNTVVGPRLYRGDLQGPVVTARFNALESVTLEEAVKYHLENNISITENAFRPGSDMFFQLIGEAKRLYAEGKYTPVDEYEQDLLNSDIGEIAEYEGQLVVLDYPVVEGLEEACWSGYTQKGMKKKGDKMVPNCVSVNEEEGGSDPTGGHGIGKPWRTGGGGAVYVRTGDGVRKVNFSQSGMKKRYNEPGRVRSFVARHHCLTNKDRTSASYWACRWPRFFSDSGQTWW